MEKKVFEIRKNKDSSVNGRVRQAVKEIAERKCKRLFKKGLSSMLEQFIMNELEISEAEVKAFKAPR